MIFLISALCILLGFFLIVNYWGRKYGNPWKVYLIFGKRGVGKSSDICKRALYYKRKGFRVFCTDKELCKVCEYMPVESLGFVALPRKSVLFVEECGVTFHKRGFSDKEQQRIMTAFRRYLKYARHQGNIVYMYSQCYDIDLSLKEACDELWLYTKYFNVFTYGRRINKSIVLTTDADGNGSMADSFTFDSFFMSGSRCLTYIPRYIKYYDSFCLLDLPSYDDVFVKADD